MLTTGAQAGAAQLVSLVLLAWYSLEVRGHYHPPTSDVMTSSNLKHVRGPHHPRDHTHYSPNRTPQGPGTKLTQDKQLLRDEEHIREDLGNWISKEDTKKMSGEELEFHYFKLHDFDNNTKLDGLEILQAIQHIVHKEQEHNTPTPDEDFKYYVELIDKVLAEDDLDNDGYLSYIEYVLGRQKDDHEMQKQQEISAQ